MSLHDSPLADAAIKEVVLHTLCAAPHSAPMYAADLVQHAGLHSALLVTRLTHAERVLNYDVELLSCQGQEVVLGLCVAAV